MYSEEKILILDLLKVLQKHTDEKHGITQDEIRKILKTEYDTACERRTVKNNIEKLIRYGERADANEILYTPSKRNMKNQKTGKKEPIDVFSDFAYVHDFTHAELRLIIDSILFSKQIPSSQREEIIRKLEGLSSKHFNSRVKHISALSSNGPINNDLFYNIEVLDEAIHNNEQVSFQYNHYNVDEKSNLLLTPRVNREGIAREYIINPYQMVATNGRYYLICNNDYFDNISHYRLDRITNIKELKTKRKPIKEIEGYEDGRLNLPKHMQEHIYMFAGESISVRLRFNKRVLSEFVDWFGTDNISFSDQTEDEVTVSVRVNRTAMRKWALQYAIHVRVLSPESLVDEIKEDITQAWEKYQ